MAFENYDDSAVSRRDRATEKDSPLAHRQDESALPGIQHQWMDRQHIGKCSKTSNRLNENKSVDGVFESEETCSAVCDAWSNSRLDGYCL